jgi:hypothetical protein
VGGAERCSCCAFLTAFAAVFAAVAAAALHVQNIRKKFPLVLGRINQLIARLDALGPQASVDVSAPRLQEPHQITPANSDSAQGLCVQSCSHVVWG